MTPCSNVSIVSFEHVIAGWIIFTTLERVLEQVCFAVSQTELDIKLKKLYIRVASGMARWLSIAKSYYLRLNFRKISILGADIKLDSVSIPEIEIWQYQ